MDCSHLEDLYELYLLSALEAGERDEVQEHVIDRCPSCLTSLREAAETLYWLTQNVAQARPAPAVRARILQRLASDPAPAKKQRSAAHVVLQSPVAPRRSE